MADDKFYADFGQGRPKAPRKLLPAAAKIAVAGVGGLIAGRVDAVISDLASLKAYPAAGTLGVFAVATGMEYYFSEDKTVHGILRQIAAGMGGWVGDDLWYFAKDLIGLGTPEWKPQPYKLGSEVKYVGGVWIASKDIPYPPIAEPGKDARWVRRAQGFRLASMADYRGAAQALLSEERLWNAIGQDQATLFGPDVERLISERLGQDFQFSEADRQEFVNRARSVLTDVVSGFAQAA